MALFNSSASESQTKPAPQAAGGKARMSMFSFGSSSSIPKSNTKSVPPISTSPNSTSSLSSFPSTKQSAKSPTLGPSKNAHLNSPACSPVAEDEQLSEYASSHIFERSVQDTAGQVKQEDYIPPALDATAQILSDKDTDLDDVEMVYSSRRNSSVIGLNMALGRPYTPSRKNSVYMSSSGNVNSSAPGGSGHSFSQSSLTNPQSAGASQGQTQSPVSPPKLLSSRSSVSFYSYADMLNNDEFARRPSLMQAYSHGALPQRKMSVTSNGSTTSNGQKGMDFNKNTRRSERSYSQSQLSKQFKDRSQNPQFPKKNQGAKPTDGEPSQKFLISPESSDSEDREEPFYPSDANNSKASARRRSIISDMSNGDNDSFVSTSVGDCIRECSTEISGM